MDAFYASIEQRDDASLKGKPIAVGGAGKRGVVATASYEARRFGVGSAMPSTLAAKKCPDLIFVPPRFEVYKEVSKQIREVFFQHTELVEPLSLDEAYLDVTNDKQSIRSATLIARNIKDEIKKKTQLTASAGISVNKFLAKIASDYHKPDGLTLIPPDKVTEFISDLPIERFHGIGPATAKKMHSLDIRKGGDLINFSERKLVSHFGKVGRFFYKIARGEDNRPVNPERIRKSVGIETTYSEDLTSLDQIRSELDALSHSLLKRLQKNNTYGRTLTLKIKYSNFNVITRAKTSSKLLTNLNDLKLVSTELLDEISGTSFKIRLLGLTVSKLDNDSDDNHGQLSLRI